MSDFLVMKRALRRVRLVEQGPAATVPADQLEQLKKQHQAELERVRKQAFEDGERAAQQKMKSQIDAYRNLATDTLTQLSSTEESLLHQVEQALPELILNGIGQILDEWKPEASQIEEIVHKLLEGMHGESGPLRIYLAPVDREWLKRLQDKLESEFPGIELVEDSRLRSGECYVQGRFGITDGRFGAKLENLRNLL